MFFHSLKYADFKIILFNIVRRCVNVQCGWCCTVIVKLNQGKFFQCELHFSNEFISFTLDACTFFQYTLAHLLLSNLEIPKQNCFFLKNATYLFWIETIFHETDNKSPEHSRKKKYRNKIKGTQKPFFPSVGV